MPEINGVTVPFLPVGGINTKTSPITKPDISKTGRSFDDIFSDELNSLKFSAHAQSRLNSRDITLSTNDVTRLTNAVNRAQEKGANESLILLDEKAFVVSIPNKTVITVVKAQQMQNNVVTDIDSAVFA